MTGTPTSPRIKNPILFICDIQEKFRPAIHEYPSVIATAQKLLRAATTLSIPVLATTQQRAKLGTHCAELELEARQPPLLADADKTRFSMWVPAVREAVDKFAQSLPVDRNADSTDKVVDVVIVGIETHICVLQTTLDLMGAGHRVWVVVDGVSSCNEPERNVALERMQREGARVTTSESVIYEIMEDAGHKGFKEVAGLVKETKATTKDSVQALCKM